MVAGFTFPVELGRSWVAAKNMPNPQATSLQIAGFSDQAMLAGISVPLLQLGLPDRFIEHGDPAQLLSLCGLDATGIEQSIRRRVGGSRPAIESFKAFRGREPRIDALLRHQGMA